MRDSTARHSLSSQIERGAGIFFSFVIRNGRYTNEALFRLGPISFHYSMTNVIVT